GGGGGGARGGPADGEGDGWPAAVEGDGHEIEPEGLLEHFTGEVAGRPESGMGVAQLTRAGFYPGDEFLHAGGWNGGIHQQHLRRYAHERYRREVGRRVEAELGEQARIDHERAADDEDSIAVGRPLRCQRGADVAAATGMVLHVELLAEAFRQLGCEHSCDRVDRAARCEWRDHLYRPIGISGFLREARTCDQKQSEAERDDLHLRISLCVLVPSRLM